MVAATLALVACGGGAGGSSTSSSRGASQGATGEESAPASPSIDTDEQGYLRTPDVSIDEFVKVEREYALFDAFDDSYRGTLEISNGWAVETSDGSSARDQFSLSPISTPWQNCQGEEGQVRDMFSDRTYRRWNVLCRAEKDHSERAQGYSGGQYKFQMRRGDLFWQSLTEGGLPTYYRLRLPGSISPTPRSSAHGADEIGPDVEREVSRESDVSEPSKPRATVIAYDDATAPGSSGASPDSGDGFVEPSILHKTTPAYPPESLSLGEETLVKLKAKVLTDGSVERVVLWEMNNHDRLVNAAIEEVEKNWRFAPGTVNGVPADMWHKVYVQFRLD